MGKNKSAGILTEKTLFFIQLIIIIVSAIISASFYHLMPDKMATHWDSAGQVNGYSSKAFGLFFVPALSFFLWLIFLAIPYLDPMKKNIDSFKRYYQGFIIATLLFMLYMHLFTIAWSLGIKINSIQALSPAFAMLMYFMGILVGKSKQNWFIGVRTPWTLSSVNVWNKTCSLGRKLYKTCGIIALLGLFLPNFAIFFILTPLLLTSAYLVLYSYLEFRKENKKRKIRR